MAGDIGQTQIEDNYIWCFVFDLLLRTAAIGGLDHTITFGSQAYAQQVADGWLVIDHKHSDR